MDRIKHEQIFEVQVTTPESGFRTEQRSAPSLEDLLNQLEDEGVLCDGNIVEVVMS